MTDTAETPTVGGPAPRVSVIIIFFNSEDYLEEAIASVLAQSFQDFELILVDDGSSDSSSAMARAHAAAQPGKIRFMEHPGHQNRGMSATRNLGLSAARGDYIAFLDSDDRWRPGKLRDQVALLDRHADVAAVGGATNYWGSANGGEDRIVPTGHVHNCIVQPPDALIHLYPLGKASPPCPSDLLLRRSVVERIGGFEESFTGPLQMYEDQAFLAKLHRHFPVYFDDRVWLDYRVHDRSCCAVATRSGHYDGVRRHFLHWLDGYLAALPSPTPPAVRAALNRAIFPYRHPRVARALRSLRGAGRRVLVR